MQSQEKTDTSGSQPGSPCGHTEACTAGATDRSEETRRGRLYPRQWRRREPWVLGTEVGLEGREVKGLGRSGSGSTREGRDLLSKPFTVLNGTPNSSP